MDSEIFFNILWSVPLVVWFVMRNKSQILKSTMTGVSLGLVISYASAGLHALHFAWPISEAFGQLGFYLSFFHDLAGIRVAIFLHLVSAHSPIADDQRLLIEVVNIVSWAIVYGVLGMLWGYSKNRWRRESGNNVVAD